ncbi:unnamed protein product [Toxocara canis]|uniref:Very-long-chain (3R)-3-hydroxyacyl-CoA dehydratase n=1 Tax=Toxocara canis TaxID=6265 RepID=A0A183UVU6_TOXCA|nr:unnamed protein product [Toxocara canis]
MNLPLREHQQEGVLLVTLRSALSIALMRFYHVVFEMTFPQARSSIGVPMLLLAWSITEVVRYSFYAFSLSEAAPKLLVWMRYTFFIVLYPMGASGELLTIFAALPEVAAKKHFTIEMPNAANIAFSFWWYLVMLILFYIPGFPQMYFYMFGQRKKVLSRDAEKKLE